MSTVYITGPVDIVVLSGETRRRDLEGQIISCSRQLFTARLEMLGFKNPRYLTYHMQVGVLKAGGW